MTIISVSVDSSSALRLRAEAVFTNVFEPSPPEITQLENQFVLLEDSHYFLSPYRTETQRTTIKLASGGIESFTKLSPSSARGNIVTFGPYKEIPAQSVSSLCEIFRHAFIMLSPPPLLCFSQFFIFLFLLFYYSPPFSS